jgi:hypothetical protein
MSLAECSRSCDQGLPLPRHCFNRFISTRLVNDTIPVGCVVTDMSFLYGVITCLVSLLELLRASKIDIESFIERVISIRVQRTACLTTKGFPDWNFACSIIR